MLLSDVAGWLGAGVLLAGYALLSAGRIRASAGYQVLNLAGSVGLAVSAATHRAWPSAAVNTVWLAIALAALARLAAAGTSLDGGVQTGSVRSRGADARPAADGPDRGYAGAGGGRGPAG